LTIFDSRDALLRYEEVLRTEGEVDEILDNLSGAAVERSNKIIELTESLYARWKTLIAAVKDRKEEDLRRQYGLERFEEGD
jgi:hypothetical protein